MGYKIVDPDEIDPLPDRPSDAYPICGTTSEENPFEYLGIRIYTPQPGEQLPTIYHYNEIQEEAFYVISGTLHVETPGEIFEVESGNFFLVEPGNPHRAFNPAEAEGPIRVLAMGAPTDDRGQIYLNEDIQEFIEREPGYYNEKQFLQKAAEKEFERSG